MIMAATAGSPNHLHRESPLYDHPIPVELISSHGTSSMVLNFRALRGTRSQENIFRFEFTDESRLNFLFIMELGENEYPQFKQEMSLRVDFSSFPHQLIQLVQFCCDSHSPSLDSSSTTAAAQKPTHLARFDIRGSPTCFFSVHENTNFKEVMHIQLKVSQLSDAGIIEYYASRLYFANVNVDKLQHDLQMQVDRVAVLEQVNLRTAAELQETSIRRDVDLQSLQSDHKERMSDALLQSNRERELLRAEHERQVCDLRNQLDEIKSANRERIDALEKRIDDLKGENSHLDYQCKDFKRKLALSEENFMKVSDELAQGQRDRRELEAIRVTQERESARLSAKLEALVQQLQDKETMLNQATAMVRDKESAQSKADDIIRDLTNQREEMAAKVKAGQAEIERRNLEISKLDAKLEYFQQQLRDKEEGLRHKTADFMESKSRQDELGRQLSASMNESQQLKFENEKFQQRIQNLERELQETKEKLVKSNEVCEYLAEQQRVADASVALHANLNTITHTVSSPSHFNEGLQADRSDLGAFVYGMDPGATTPLMSNMLPKTSSRSSRLGADLNQHYTPNTVANSHTPVTTRRWQQKKLSEEYDASRILGMEHVASNAKSAYFGNDEYPSLPEPPPPPMEFQASKSVGNNHKQSSRTNHRQDNNFVTAAAARDEVKLRKGLEILGLSDEDLNLGDLSFDQPPSTHYNTGYVHHSGGRRSQIVS